MARKERAGIDIDEVLSDSLASFLNVYNPEHNTGFKREDFWVYNDWAKVMGASNDYLTRKFQEFVLRDGLTIPTVPGSLEGLDKLREKFELVSATYRPNILETATRNYLEQNFPGRISEVAFANHYSLNGGKKYSKSELAVRMGFTHLVEDQPHTAIECASIGIKVYLLKTPWNKGVNFPKNLSIFGPFDSWEKITSEILGN